MTLASALLSSGARQSSTFPSLLGTSRSGGLDVWGLLGDRKHFPSGTRGLSLWTRRVKADGWQLLS